MPSTDVVVQLLSKRPRNVKDVAGMLRGLAVAQAGFPPIRRLRNFRFKDSKKVRVRFPSPDHATQFKRKVRLYLGAHVVVKSVAPVVAPRGPRRRTRHNKSK